MWQMELGGRWEFEADSLWEKPLKSIHLSDGCRLFYFSSKGSGIGSR